LNVWGFRVRVLEIEFERGVLWEWKNYYCWVDLIGFVRCVLHILGLKSINLTRIPWHSKYTPLLLRMWVSK
jgi:hypothetical protein